MEQDGPAPGVPSVQLAPVSSGGWLLLPCTAVRPARHPSPTHHPALSYFPAAASWRYDYQVDPQGPEQKFLDAVRNPHAVNWV